MAQSSITHLLSLKVVDVSTELYPDSTVPKLLISSAIDGTGESRIPIVRTYFT